MDVDEAAAAIAANSRELRVPIAAKVQDTGLSEDPLEAQRPSASGVGSDAEADHARSAAVLLSGAHPEKGSVIERLSASFTMTRRTGGSGQCRIVFATQIKRGLIPRSARLPQPPNGLLEGRKTVEKPTESTSTATQSMQNSRVRYLRCKNYAVLGGSGCRTVTRMHEAARSIWEFGHLRDVIRRGGDDRGRRAPGRCIRTRSRRWVTRTSGRGCPLCQRKLRHQEQTDRKLHFIFLRRR